MDELDVAREWMLLLGRKTAREKITFLLALIARRTADLHLAKVSDGLEFEMPMSREEMSNYLGLTIETVSRQMTALRKDGIISLKGTRDITIPDMARLMAETGDDGDRWRIFLADLHEPFALSEQIVLAARAFSNMVFVVPPKMASRRREWPYAPITIISQPISWARWASVSAMVASVRVITAISHLTAWRAKNCANAPPGV